MNPTISHLYEEWFAKTGDASAAATLVLAQVQAGDCGQQEINGVMDAASVTLSKRESRRSTQPIDAVLLTVKQAAEHYNIGERTLYRLVKGGELPHHRIGSAIRIKPMELERYLEDQSRPQAALGSLFD